ncbi:bifunctional nicotinamidase/pyrazinamidase [Persicobacter psychrovividus]|uniref:nicotinamidase n=1 Tax=Persicobacter psychrovividus TaxID=387638 RepID=A0ABM7VKI5_9BACT|nr:nicotinamidase [Persicobacter psychrovividus]
MNALLLIDIQYDFLQGGALAVPNANEILPVLQKLFPKFNLIFASQDFHPADHRSFASQHQGKQIGEVINLDGLPQVLWPDHCVQGTAGVELHSDLPTDKFTAVVQKGQDVKVDSYSAFFDNGHRHATGLDQELKENGVTKLFVAGLATDYCVKFSVLDALKLGYEVVLIADAVRAVNLDAKDGERSIEEMKSKGASIILSELLINEKML